MLPAVLVVLYFASVKAAAPAELAVTAERIAEEELHSAEAVVLAEDTEPVEVFVVVRAEAHSVAERIAEEELHSAEAAVLAEAAVHLLSVRIAVVMAGFAVETVVPAEGHSVVLLPAPAEAAAVLVSALLLVNLLAVLAVLLFYYQPDLLLLRPAFLFLLY